MTESRAVPTVGVRGQAYFIRRFAVAVTDGADRGTRAVSQAEELSIGTAEGNELRLADPAVSRHHCVLRTSERGLELRDLGSTNGVFVGETEVQRAFVRDGAQLRLGHTTISVEILDQEIEQAISPQAECGDLIGASPAMRRLYPLIEQFATSMATVLIHGETGTGKELIAEAIHQLGPRRRAPFIVVDCGALPRDLTESELFGHVRGAFTGAEANREGAFETAAGGTIFLDEIGELPLHLQPLLLRALENKAIRRVGSNEYRPIDVRVIAASHRDLRTEVNHKRFRADLFYRLNVLRIGVPPLRERAGDVERLAQHFWRAMSPDRAPPAELIADLAAQSWPGNVRELRNAVERAALVGWEPGPAPPLSYGQAKEVAIAAWERPWVERLLAANSGNLSRAARAARMGRSHLRELIKSHHVVVPTSTEDEDGAG
jgi:DNA-binding NtrC family response regulator